MVVAPKTAEIKPSKLASLSTLPTNGFDANDDEGRLRRNRIGGKERRRRGRASKGEEQVKGKSK